jgi:hypothetical protein
MGCWALGAGRLTVTAAVLAVLAAGCASTHTSKQHLVGIENRLAGHEFAAALAQIQAAKTTAYQEKDRILYYLDAGMLCHYNAHWGESNELLTQAEYAIEEAYTRSVSKAATSIMLNDNALEYAGEDYENIYLNVFKAINFLQQGAFDPAFVEVRRISDKLNLLEDKYAKMATEYNKSTRSSGTDKTFQPGQVRFHNSALARYMSMLMYRTEGRRDDARIDLEKAADAWGAAREVYPFPLPSFALALAPSPDAYAKLNVFGFYGRSPDKLASTLYIHTQPDSVTIMTTQQQSAGKTEMTALEVIPWGIGNVLPAGTTIKFQMPYMKMRGSQVGRAVLYLNGYAVTDLQPLESIEAVARETFRIKEPLIFLKTITRVIGKTIVKAKAMEELKKHKDGQYVPGFLVDMAVAATENADLRVGQFFPAVAAISEVEVPVGEHRATVVYFDKAGNRLYQDELGTVQVRAGKLNLLQSYYLN